MKTKREIRICLMAWLLGLVCCISLPCHAESVWGLEKLAPKDEVKKSIVNRFGYNNFKDKGDVITVIDPSIGGVDFNFCDIIFNFIDGELRFNQIRFDRIIVNDNIELAKQTVDYLANNLKKKYGDDNVLAYTNDYGFTAYGFYGPAFNDVIGYLEIVKGFGKDGTERLYMNLVYYPFRKDAVADEL